MVAIGTGDVPLRGDLVTGIGSAVRSAIGSAAPSSLACSGERPKKSLPT